MTFQPAKRGDLIVIHQSNRGSYQHGADQTLDSFILGTVTSVSRDGIVKKVALRDYINHDGVPLPIERFHGLVGTTVAPATQVDVQAALSGLSAHVYEQAKDSVRPFKTLDEVREYLRPFRKEDAD